MDSEMTKSIKAADRNAQYDECAKRLLGNKRVLAHILVHTVEEFKGMDPETVVSFIEGEPYINKVLVDPGLTNIRCLDNGKRVVGLNTEHGEINEGIVRYDIVFYVRMKDGISQIIVNVEAQKAEPTQYRILNRAIFYVGRLVSSQKERDFQGINYDDIKRVYSLWICMNLPENCFNHIHLVDDRVMGNHEWKGKLDLINIGLIGLTEEIPEKQEGYELHRLIGTLLSEKLSIEEKLKIIETEYHIPFEEEMKEDAQIMCNLSEGIQERGIKMGKEMGEANIIRRCYARGFSQEELADITGKKLKEIREIVSGTEWTV